MAPVLALPMTTPHREPLLVVEPLTLYFARKQLTPPVGLAKAKPPGDFLTPR